HRDARLLEPHAGDEVLAIGCERSAFLLGRAERDLLGRPVRISLAPHMGGSASVRREIYPLPVAGPGGRRALAIQRPDGTAYGATVDRHAPARQPLDATHHDDEDCRSIR